MEILLDFDGTVVKHEFPKVGEDIGAVPVLKKLVEAGHKLILFTMRSDVENPTTLDKDIVTESGNFLTQAINWFEENDIPLYGIQTNPTQHTWTTSPKAYGQLIIDDTALGIPLIKKVGQKPYVDWHKLDIYFSTENYYGESNKEIIENYCCETFEIVAATFLWYSFVNEDGEMGSDEDTRTRIMPIIKDTGMRVNYCPGCGTKIRNIHTTREAILKAHVKK